MTQDELYQIMRKYRNTDAEALHAVQYLLGEILDGETEKINTAKSVSPTSAVTEESSATDHPQPIATAPEYTRVLVYCQRVAVNTGWWQIAEFDEDIGEWLDDAVDGELLLVKPTLWLPLPPAPTQSNP